MTKSKDGRGRQGAVAGQPPDRRTVRLDDDGGATVVTIRQTEAIVKYNVDDYNGAEGVGYI